MVKLRYLLSFATAYCRHQAAQMLDELPAHQSQGIAAATDSSVPRR